MSSQATSSKPDVRYASIGSGHYAVILAVFCTVIVVSNIVAAKPIEVGSGSVVLGPLQLWPLVVDGGVVLFPLAYVLGDVLTEVYGFKAAFRAVVTGFGTAVLAVGTFALVQVIPGASFYEFQDSYENVLGPVPQILLASIVGFVAGQLSNAAVLTRMKQTAHESRLFARLIGSTGVGEVVDTFLFCAIASSAIGITSIGVFLNYFVVGVVLKVLAELVVMPITMVAISTLKSIESTY